MLTHSHSQLIGSLLLLISLSILPHGTLSLQQAPQLECLENGMRLHFLPDTNPDGNPAQYCGHVYVKGYFFSPRCHLDYTRLPINEPFYFHIPYRSECQVRRERTTNENSITGVSYSTVVVVQHHRLFLTNRDRAYSVACFYEDNRHRVEQQVEVADLTTQPLAGVDLTPNCTYRMVRSGEEPPVEGTNGVESVHFANIGDPLVHQWQCTTEDMGILVHSCFVRDGVGSEFALVNDRGCPTDSTLMSELQYPPQLNAASTVSSIVPGTRNFLGSWL